MLDTEGMKDSTDNTRKREKSDEGRKKTGKIRERMGGSYSNV